MSDDFKRRRQFLLSSMGILGGLAMSGKPAYALRPVITARQVHPRTRQLRLCIDPGHGGRDPGAIGHHGTYEKHVVLDIGRRLHRLTEPVPHLHAFMTRDSDHYITLEDRVLLAQKHQADLFVAIHADAFQSEEPHGSSTYAFTNDGASSESAFLLAESQNKLDRGYGLRGATPGSLRQTLFDLDQTAVIGQSMGLAGHILRHTEKLAGALNPVPQRAPFVVLASPTFPSTLVETAFISNPRQEMMLRTAAFRQHMAEAILAGVLEYARENRLLA